MKSSYLNSYGNFHTISFGSEPTTDKMIKALVATKDSSLPNPTATITKLDDGTTIRLELVHEVAGRAYINKDKQPATALKSANKLHISIKPPATLDSHLDSICS